MTIDLIPKKYRVIKFLARTNGLTPSFINRTLTPLYDSDSQSVSNPLPPKAFYGSVDS